MIPRPKVTATEIVHKNPWYQIRHDVLEYPDKKTGQYFVAETPKTALVIARRGEHVLMVEQYRHTMQKDSLEFPSGTCKGEETLEAAATRELQEETGFETNTFTFLGSFYSLNGFANNHVHAFYTTALESEGATALDPEEQGLQARWIEIASLPSLIKNGIIQDGESMAAWILLLAHQGEKTIS